MKIEGNYFNDSSILDNKKKSYGKYTISKYKLEYVLKEIEKSIKEKKIYNMLYFLTELHASGKFIILNEIFIKYTILNFNLKFPNLPNILWNYLSIYSLLKNDLKSRKINNLNLRNNMKIRKNIWKITHILNLENLSIDNFISDSFYAKDNINFETINNYNNDDILINELFKDNQFNNFTYYATNLKHLLESMLNKYNIINLDITKNRIFYFLGKVLNYDNRKDNYNYDNNIDQETIFSILWNIILNISKNNKYIFEQNSSLYKIYKYILKNNKNLNNFKYLKYIILCSILYIIYFNKIDWKNNILSELENSADFIKINVFYQNIQQAIKNNTNRYDYIEVECIKNKKKIAKNQSTNYDKNIIKNYDKENIEYINYIKKKTELKKKKRKEKYNLLDCDINEAFNIVPMLDDTNNNDDVKIVKTDYNHENNKKIINLKKVKKKKKNNIIINKI